jgi:thiol-disulfide isomerase/thioredoxin
MWIIGAAALLGSGCQRGADGPSPQAGEVTLQIVDYAGLQQVVARHRGKVVVLDAWSTGCPPCVAEFPRLVALHKKHGPGQVACVSLSLDYEGIGRPEDQREMVLTFLREQGATFDNLLSSEESQELYKKLQLGAVPAVYVYDRKGALRKRFDNDGARTPAEEFSYDQVEQLVTELLAEPAEG